MPGCAQLHTALTASGSAKGPDSETYMFDSHVNVNCFRLLHRDFSKKAEIWSFYNNCVSITREMLLSAPNYPQKEICSSNVRYLISITAELLFFQRHNVFEITEKTKLFQSECWKIQAKNTFMAGFNTTVRQMTKTHIQRWPKCFNEIKKQLLKTYSTKGPIMKVKRCATDPVQ